MPVKLDRVIEMEKTISAVKQQIKDHCEENNDRFDTLEETTKEIRKDIGVVKASLDDLRINHIVFKTKTLVWLAIGAGVLSAIVQLGITYLGKHI